MTLASSEVSFKSLAATLGVAEEIISKLHGKGIKCMADFAYSTPYVPGQSDDTQFVERIVVPVLGQDRDKHEFKLRRLLFESYAVATEEIRAKGGRTGVDPPRKMPDRERETRLEALRQRLPGIPSYNLYEPSNTLVDQAADMLETGWRYIPWSECISRRHETQGLRRMKEFKPDSSGTLKEVIKVDPGAVQAVLGSDLKMVQLLQRRGIALDIAGIMKFEQHDLILQLLVEEMQRDQPTGYAVLSVEQLQRADKEIWDLIGKTVAKSGLQTKIEGKHPAGEAVESVINHPTVRMLLLPLAAISVNPKNKQQSGPMTTAESSQTSSSARAPKKRPRTPQPKAIAKKELKAPASIGGSATTPDGSRICFGYNDGSCPQKGPGCGRGKHICTKCFGQHPASQCKAGQ